MYSFSAYVRALRSKAAEGKTPGSRPSGPRDRLFGLVLLGLFQFRWLAALFLEDWLPACLLACLVAWLLGCLVAWLLGCLVGRSVGWLVGWVVGWLVGWLVGCWLAWLVRRFLAWLGGWLVAWLFLPGRNIELTMM